MKKTIDKRTLQEVVQTEEGKILLLPEKTPLKAKLVWDKINMVYNVKAHYRDGIDWDDGERNTLFNILEEGIRKRNMDVDFVSIGPRSVYLKGVSIFTWGANTIDHLRLCQGECKGHDYQREIQFYKRK